MLKFLHAILWVGWRALVGFVCTVLPSLMGLYCMVSVTDFEWALRGCVRFSVIVIFSTWQLAVSALSMWEGRRLVWVHSTVSEMMELPVCAAAWSFGTKYWTFRQAGDGTGPANISFLMALFQNRAGSRAAFLCSNALTHLQHIKSQTGSSPVVSFCVIIWNWYWLLPSSTYRHLKLISQCHLS